MPSKRSIPIRSIPEGHAPAIALAKVTDEAYRTAEELQKAHRHDHHFFVLQVKGTTRTEVDFVMQEVHGAAIMYQSPDQVHRSLGTRGVELYLLLIGAEHIPAIATRALQRLAPVAPLPVSGQDLSVLKNTFALCLQLFERRADALYLAQLKNSANTLVSLFISLYTTRSSPAAPHARHAAVADRFKALLEERFVELKRPADYAERLNISVPYLNECVKQHTGLSVSQQIQQRVVLEAKRLLHHSDRSVKEIAAELGYDDHPYFSRLFTKVAGRSAAAFRRENRD